MKLPVSVASVAAALLLASSLALQPPAPYPALSARAAIASIPDIATLVATTAATTTDPGRAARSAFGAVTPTIGALVRFFTDTPTPTSAPLTGDELPAHALRCLTTAIYHEARGEPAYGRELVGQVILNRRASRFYPDTVCAVIYQGSYRRNGCQFSFACDGRSNRAEDGEVWTEIREQARLLLACAGDVDCQLTRQSDPIWSSTHYHADYVDPFWAKKISRVGAVGQHIFYYTATM